MLHESISLPVTVRLKNTWFNVFFHHGIAVVWSYTPQCCRKYSFTFHIYVLLTVLVLLTVPVGCHTTLLMCLIAIETMHIVWIKFAAVVNWFDSKVDPQCYPCTSPSTVQVYLYFTYFHVDIAQMNTMKSLVFEPHNVVSCLMGDVWAPLLTKQLSQH